MFSFRFLHCLLAVLCFQLSVFQPAFSYELNTVTNTQQSPHQQGRIDGRPDGAREARERGSLDGRKAGQTKGHHDGFRKCETEEKRRHYDRGYREGFLIGENEGFHQGDFEGRRNGEINGNQDGKRDGARQADQDARVAATPLGRDQGRDEANESDASAKGDQDGTVAGDEYAQNKALNEDYPRGRRAYNDEKFAEPVENQDEFSQREGLAKLEEPMKSFASLVEEKFALSTLAPAPDYRYHSPKRNYQNPQKNQQYRQGYRSGYQEGFRNTYNQVYQQHYQSTYQTYYQRGCQQARSRNYHAEYTRGHRIGRREGYQRGYQRNYDRAYNDTYHRVYRRAHDISYQDTYSTAYHRHFESARAEAYQERYNELYQSAFDQAKTRKFNEVYPIYAEQQFSRGRADEEREFNNKPVRLLSVQATETIANGLYEPGETLRVSVKLRNFADTALNAQDVKVKMIAMSKNSSIISDAEQELVQELKLKSVTTVNQALEFTLTHPATTQRNEFTLEVYYKGRKTSEKQFFLNAKYHLGLELDGIPELSEGIAKPINVKITNQSPTESSDSVTLHFGSNSRFLEIVSPEITVGPLTAGEERVVQFMAVALTSGSPRIPFMFEATNLSSGRRIGLMDQSYQVPVMNDYIIHTTNDSSALRSKGVHRVEYVIRNMNSRMTHQGLQLKVQFTGENADLFEVIGPNPQYLSPLNYKKRTSFVIPVLVKEDNSGATLELEVQENGSTVVKHQVNFADQMRSRL